MKQMIIIIAILAIFVSCKDSTEKIEMEFLTRTFDSSSIQLRNYKWIIILPGIGCHGCVQEGELFMKRNIDKHNVLYILTRLSSIKILQQKIGINLKECSNIYIDRDDMFFIPTENAIYPCVIKLENGKIISHIFQNPRNDAFGEIVFDE